MMLRLLAVTSLLCLLTSAQHDVTQRKTYYGYQVADIIPKSHDEVKFLRQLMTSDDHLDLDFWAEPSFVGKTVTVMAPPIAFVRLQLLLRKQNIEFTTTVDNVNDILEPMWAEVDRHQLAKRSGQFAFDLDQFNTFFDIYAWMVELQPQCRSGITCEVYSVGSTYNGIPILVFHIFKSEANRKAYWIDATIHAREWIAPATVLKVLDALAHGTNDDAVRLTEDFDWYIMPIMNPDGYDYTFTNERLWRKNRRPNPGSNCFGTDLNRNFDFRWGTEGVSHNPCGETFCGPSGGSEPETQHVQRELVRVGSTLLASVTVHSYGNMWMFPWGNTVNHAGQTCERSDDHDELMRVSNITANAIQATYSTNWLRGNSCEVIYTTTGGTDDYAKGVAGVKYAFCPELRGINFIVLPSAINLSFTEFWNGIVAMAGTIPQS